MPSTNPDVSILVSVYNHEKYIEKCLRGIAMQKTSYTYEVIIGEDCSTDNTRAVLKRLEQELPDSFVFLYREQNIGAVANGEDLYSRARGRYLFDIEGDDFWIYDGKIQEQVGFLEAHPDYSAVYTSCVVVGQDSEPNGELYPECQDDEYSYREFFYYTLPGQSSTMVCRTQDYFSARTRFMDMRSFETYAGDRRNAFLFLTMGKVRCVHEQWSAYRHVVSNGSSFSATLKIDEKFAKNQVGYGETLVRYAQELNDPVALEAAKETYYRLLLRWSVGKIKPYRLGASLRKLMGERRWIHYLLGVPRWYLVLGARVLSGRPVIL